MSDPALIRREIARRLEDHRRGPAATSERSHLQRELSRAEAATRRLLVAYEEELVSLDDLRRRMPELRRREKTLRGEMESLDQRLASEGAYLQLAENLEDFLARLSDAAAHASIRERQQILRLVIRDVLVDTDSVVIRHTIPNSGPAGDPSCHLRGSRVGRHRPAGGDPRHPRLPGLNSRAPPLTPAASPKPTDLELGFEEPWPIDEPDDDG